MAQWAGYARILRREGLPFQALDSVAGNRTTVFQKWLANPVPGPYWDQISPTPAQYARMTQPILTITGAYDGDQLGTLTHYRTFLQNASAAERNNIWLVIGPWDHGGTRVPTREVNGVQFGPASMVNIHQLHKEWYDWTLRGAGSKPEFLKNRVAYYVAGANGDVWRYADSLEAVANEKRSYFLNSVAGRAGDAFGGGRLDRAAPVHSDPDTWTYNPLDPPDPGDVTHPSALSFIDPAPGQGGRAAILRGTDPRAHRRDAGDLGCHRQARLGDGAGVAGHRTGPRPAPPESPRRHRMTGGAGREIRPMRR